MAKATSTTSTARKATSKAPAKPARALPVRKAAQTVTWLPKGKGPRNCVGTAGNRTYKITGTPASGWLVTAKVGTGQPKPLAGGQRVTFAAAYAAAIAANSAAAPFVPSKAKAPAKAASKAPAKRAPAKAPASVPAASTAGNGQPGSAA
jgi:hypothetical protein